MVHKMNRQQYYRYELLRNLHCRSVFNVPACPTSYIPSFVSQNRRHRSKQTDRCRTIFLPNCQPFSCKTFRPSPRNGPELYCFSSYHSKAEDWLPLSSHFGCSMIAWRSTHLQYFWMSQNCYSPWRPLDWTCRSVLPANRGSLWVLAPAICYMTWLNTHPRTTLAVGRIWYA